MKLLYCWRFLFFKSFCSEKNRDKINNMGKYRYKELRNFYFLLRHGETEYQLKKVKIRYPWIETTPILLTEQGERQIENVAQKLKKEKIDLIYSSDTSRTCHTAKIVVRELGLKIIFDPRLRDLNLGIYCGRPMKEFFRDFPDPKKRFSKRPKDGESWSDCKQRVIDFIEDIDKKHKNKKILIISHADPLWLLEGAIKGLSNEELLEQKFRRETIKAGELRKLN